MFGWVCLDGEAGRDERVVESFVSKKGWLEKYVEGKDG